jgi:hypothetical protein
LGKRAEALFLPVIEGFEGKDEEREVMVVERGIEEKKNMRSSHPDIMISSSNP